MLRAIFVGFVALVFCAAGAAAHASAFTILYSFCSQSGCADGFGGTTGYDFGNLLVEDTGLPGGPVIYGTTGDVMFQLVPDSGGDYSEYVLCSTGNSCIPPETLVVGSDGNFYGTTSGGGSGDNGLGAGVLLQIAPGSPSYVESVLHEFCSLAGCTDGGIPGAEDGPPPFAPPIASANGQLLGTTEVGGSGRPRHRPGIPGSGVIYEWSASGGYKVLYSFCSEGTGKTCPDGRFPNGLVEDDSGDLFGVTTGGGGQGEGTIFELVPDQGAVTLHRFRCTGTSGPPVCDKGVNPIGPLLRGENGALYGIARSGGVTGAGVVFRLGPKGKHLKVLYAFCAQQNCRDGGFPTSLVRDKAGNLYGTTEIGGTVDSQGGTVFELVRGEVGGMAVYTENVLRSFSIDTDGEFCTPSGCRPANLAIDKQGNLYGTMGGGADNGGAVFKLTP